MDYATDAFFLLDERHGDSGRESSSVPEALGYTRDELVGIDPDRL